MKRLYTIVPALIALLLAVVTIVEKYHGSPFVAEYVYGSWWFTALMAIVAIGAVVAIIAQRLWKSPERLLVYASIPLILVGGGLTTLTGTHGQLTLTPQVPASTFVADGEECALPFAITLQSFEVVPYPGTHTPMDFVSHIEADGEQFDISMNHIYRHRGYRFYQEDYDEQGNSTLSVAHDPYGIAVTYVGYALLVIGLLWMLIAPKGAYRRWLKAPLLLALLLSGAAHAANPPTLTKAEAAKMGELYVLYKGRICPLQTYAKDFTTKLTGNATYRGLTSEQVLSGFLFYLDAWCDEPCIKASGEQVKQACGIEGRRASYIQLSALDALPQSPTTDKKLKAATERYNLVKMLISGRQPKLFPVRDTAMALSWYAQNDPLPLAADDDEYLFIRNQLAYCQELVVMGKHDELMHVFEKTCLYQEQRAAQELPPQARIRAERLYNGLTTGRWLPMVAILLGLIAFAYTLTAIGKGHSVSRAAHVVLQGMVVLLTLFLLVIFALRWVAGGHIPMAGGFDSMNLMAIAIGLIAFAIGTKHPMASAAGLMTMGFCQLVAMMSGSNPPITHLMPVLTSPLLTLHVTVIMLSYALFFFMMTLGIAGLALKRHADIQRRLMRMSLLMLLPAVVLLSAGIIIGAIWANISWGNYWSWDPKEVWALITLLLYAIPIVRATEATREGRPLCATAYHLFCTLAFLSVIITYFGVNFILGGIHAYN